MSDNPKDKHGKEIKVGDLVRRVDRTIGYMPSEHGIIGNVYTVRGFVGNTIKSDGFTGEASAGSFEIVSDAPAVNVTALEREISGLEQRVDELNVIRENTLTELGSIHSALAGIVNAVSQGGLGKASTIERMQAVSARLAGSIKTLKGR